MERKPKSKETSTGHKSLANYYLGGKFVLPDHRRVATIHSLRGQTERSHQALQYALELVGLYSNPSLTVAELERLHKELENLPKEGEANAQGAADTAAKAAALRTRIRGADLLLLCHRGVQADVLYAEQTYLGSYCQPGPSKRPTPDIDQIIDLYDQTDSLAILSPIIRTVHAMTGLDEDSRQQAERVARIMLLHVEQDTEAT